MPKKRININIQDNRPKRKKAVEEGPPRDVVWPTLLTDELFGGVVPEIEIFDGATKRNSVEIGWWDDLDMRPAESNLVSNDNTLSIPMKGQFMGMPVSSKIENHYYSSAVTDPAMIAAEFAATNASRWDRKPIGKLAGFDSSSSRMIWAEGQNTVWISEWTYLINELGVTGAQKYVRCVHNDKSYVCLETHNTQDYPEGYTEPGVGEGWHRFWKQTDIGNYHTVEVLFGKTADGEGDLDGKEAVSQDALVHPDNIPDGVKQLYRKYKEGKTKNQSFKRKSVAGRKYHIRVEEKGSIGRALYLQRDFPATVGEDWVYGAAQDTIKRGDDAPGMFFNYFDTSDTDNFKITKTPSYSAAAYTGKPADLTKGKIKVFLMPRRWAYYVRTRTTTLGSWQAKQWTMEEHNCQCAALSRQTWWGSCPCCGPPRLPADANHPHYEWIADWSNTCAPYKITWTTDFSALNNACCTSDPFSLCPTYCCFYYESGPICGDVCGGYQRYVWNTTLKFEAREVQHIHRTHLIWDRFPNRASLPSQTSLDTNLYVPKNTTSAGTLVIPVRLSDKLSDARGIDATATCGRVTLGPTSVRAAGDPAFYTYINSNLTTKMRWHRSGCDSSIVGGLELIEKYKGKWQVGQSFSVDDYSDVDYIWTFKCIKAHTSSNTNKPPFGKDCMEFWTPYFTGYADTWADCTFEHFNGSILGSFFGEPSALYPTISGLDAINNWNKACLDLSTMAWRKVAYYVDDDYNELGTGDCNKWDSIPFGLGISPTPAGELVGIILCGKTPHFVWRKTDEPLSLEVESKLGAYQGHPVSWESSRSDGVLAQPGELCKIGKIDNSYGSYYPEPYEEDAFERPIDAYVSYMGWVKHYDLYLQEELFAHRISPPLVPAYTLFSRDELLWKSETVPSPHGTEATATGRFDNLLQFFNYEYDFVDQFSGDKRKLTRIGRDREALEMGEAVVTSNCPEFYELRYYDGCWPPHLGCNCDPDLYTYIQLPIKAKDEQAQDELPVPIFVMFTRTKPRRTAGQFAGNFNTPENPDFIETGGVPRDPIQLRIY